MQETKYGIISTVYDHREFYEKILIEMMSEKVSAIILNGISPIKEIASYAIKTAAKTDLPIITIPYEETFTEYYKAIGQARTKHKNIIDSVTNQYIKQNGHEILFLPGTTDPFQSQFVLSTEKETGLYYYKEKEAKKKCSDTRNILKKINKDQIEKIFKCQKLSQNIYSIQDIESLAGKIKAPERTTIISPRPREFPNPTHSIDLEMFFKTDETEIYTLSQLAQTIISTYSEPGFEITPTEAFEEINDMIKEGDITPVYLNDGDEILRNITEKYGVTKTIASSPAASSHIAHTNNNIGIPENVLSTELHYNTGIAEEGLAGILYLKDDKAAYKNITLKENIFGNDPFHN
jgi:hypothetical protein